MTTLPQTPLARLLMLLTLLSAEQACVHAQPVDTIRPNPNAVQLRRVWSVTGGEFGGGQVGNGCANLGDVFGIGRAAFAINTPDTSIWRIYIWDTATQRVRQKGVITHHGSHLGRQGLVGNFLGDRERFMGFPSGRHYTDSSGHLRTEYYLDFYVVTGDTILDLPVLHFADTAMKPPVEINPSDWAAADLDADGADELILYMDGLYRNNVYTKYSEVWIFRGGPGLRLDTPTVVLRAMEATDQHVRRMWVNDCDGDGRLDIITFGRAVGGDHRFHVYFGRDGSPWNWSQPHRNLVVGESMYGAQLRVMDLDGDGAVDIAQAAPPGQVAIYRTREGKSYRTRPMTIDDADQRYYGGARSGPNQVGYLSDSGRTFAMLGLLGVPNVLLNGGATGPDALYDAWGAHEPYTFPGDDITGDGWDDLLAARYDNNFNAGIASIWAGGPYIPRDPAMGVRWISDGARGAAIALWPNPARDLLHLAWRGDLARMPRTIVVTDPRGRRIAEGVVPPGVGEMLWSCGGLPSGLYLLSFLDTDHACIATTTFLIVR